MFVDIIAFSCSFGSGSVHMKQQQWYPRPHLEHDSLHPCKSASKAASQSVQLFLQGSRSSSTHWEMNRQTTEVNIRYDMLYWTCAQKLTWVSLIYHTKPTTKKLNNRKTKKKKTGMLRNIGKQSGESVESDWKKKRKVTVGRICRKGRF